MLTTNKEPLASFDSIKNLEVKEVIVDNAANLDAWRGARKAVLALNVSEEVKEVLSEFLRM